MGLALAELAVAQGPAHRAPCPRPSVLLIITDDQRFDSLGAFMPQTQARIFDAGVTFSRAYATTPVCAPSRASILTGQYAHNHNVRGNNDPLTRPTFVEDLHAAGYHTGLVGKYLNAWSGAPRAEFDYWVSHAPNSLPYEDPTLNVAGAWTPHTGYTTDILGDYACEFLDQALTQPAPFLLILGARAPHLPAIPAPGDETLYPGLPPYRPPNFNELDVSDKPAWFERVNLLSEDAIAVVDDLYRKQLQTLASLDASIGAMLDRLEAAGRLDDTVVIFISDNGLFMGEHRLDLSKERLYEENCRVPFGLRYSRMVPAGSIAPALVANIDIAPTLLSLAGLPVPADMDGRSLMGLLGGQAWRDALLLEGWPDGAPFAAAHAGDIVYAETPGFEAELYDLLNDPYQNDNRTADPAYSEAQQALSQRLVELLAE
jgi:arylsulfatase A-like enzyme